VENETHSQAPIKDGKELFLKEVELDEADTTDTSELWIGGEGVAEGF